MVKKIHLNITVRNFRKRLKREYRKTLDRLVRSHAIHTIFMRTFYIIGFIVSLILGALLYFE